MTTALSAETNFFRTINRVAEPAIRAGLGSPCLWPSGLIVLETTGRQSGTARRVPVTATRLGRVILISTVRGDRSQWLRNLAVEPTLRYWLGGREHDADAIIFSPGTPLPDISALPILVRPLVPTLASLAALGMGFAILIPRESAS